MLQLWKCLRRKGEGEENDLCVIDPLPAHIFCDESRPKYSKHAQFIDSLERLGTAHPGGWRHVFKFWALRTVCASNHCRATCRRTDTDWSADVI